MDTNILGKRIKLLREEKNITQLDFAKELNISNTTLSQYESGKRIPSDEIKIKIAKYFNVSIDYLLGNTINDFKFGQRLKQLRTEKNLRQEELGKILNKTKNNISQYETEKREPDAETLKILAEYFNVSIDYLLGHTNDRKPVNSDMVSDALKDDPELVSFWNEMQEREDLKVLFKKSKRLKPDDVKQIIRMIKLIEDEEDELNQ